MRKINCKLAKRLLKNHTKNTTTKITLWCELLDNKELLVFATDLIIVSGIHFWKDSLCFHVFLNANPLGFHISTRHLLLATKFSTCHTHSEYCKVIFIFETFSITLCIFCSVHLSRCSFPWHVDQSFKVQMQHVNQSV